MNNYLRNIYIYIIQAKQLEKKNLATMSEEQLKREIEELRVQLILEKQRAEIAQLKLENDELKFSLEGSTRLPVIRDRLYTKEIPEWSGENIKPGDAEIYLERVERVACRSGWHDEERKEVLLSKMKGPAERYLRIHGTEFRACKDWKEVKDLFKKRFSKGRDLLADMRTLLKLKREVGEDYRTYADRCEEAGILAFTVDDLPTEEQREGARTVMNRVVLGMFQLGTETPIRRFLKGQDVNTLQDAVVMAERMSSEVEVGEQKNIRQIKTEEEDEPGCCCLRRGETASLEASESPTVCRVTPRGGCRNRRVPYVERSDRVPARSVPYQEQKDSLVGKRNPRTPCPKCGEWGHWMRDCQRWKADSCHKCGQIGHRLELCPSIKCFNCGELGHIRRRCKERGQDDEALNRRGSE